MERSKGSNISLAHETTNLNILLNIYEAKEIPNIHEFLITLHPLATPILTHVPSA